MTEYQIGEYYFFKVTGLNGNRICLTDENGGRFSVRGYDFQTEWDWASPQVPIDSLKCYVFAKDYAGRPQLQQSTEVLLTALYPQASRKEPANYHFNIFERKTINEVLYYVVKDAYGITHLYKPTSSQQNMLPGDDLELSVQSIEHRDYNKTRLILGPARPKETVSEAQPTSADVVELSDNPTGEFGEETATQEFKSTIVYPAGAIGPDIDSQIQIIVRTIAGFMNSDGGTLYIGVNDNGDPVGIEKEYPLLNTSEKDNNTYKEDKDGYQNKIRSSIRYYLGPLAPEYVTISFSEHAGHTICSIEVRPADCVVWFKELEAYKRLGNSTSHLRSLAIEKLVRDKDKLSGIGSRWLESTSVASEDEILSQENERDIDNDIEPVVVKVERPAVMKNVGEERNGRGSFYMNLFSNGDWSYSKERPTDKDLEYCIPINNPASKNDLVMIYEDGCVNRVDAYKLHLSKQLDRRYPGGRRTDDVKLVKVFHAQSEDLLACFCKQHNHPFVKVHLVSDVSQHETISAKGNRLVNAIGLDGVSDVNICFIASEHRNRVSALLKTGNQKSNSLGFQMDLAKNGFLQLAVNTLQNLSDLHA